VPVGLKDLITLHWHCWQALTLSCLWDSTEACLLKVSY